MHSATRLGLPSDNHLFFDCVVSKQIWLLISECLDISIGDNFTSIGTMWLSNKRFLVHNIITSAVLWGLWKLRNELCFQNAAWRDIKVILMRIATMAQNWLLLCPEGEKYRMKRVRNNLKMIATRPGRINKVCPQLWCPSGNGPIGVGRLHNPRKSCGGASTKEASSLML